MFSGGERGEIGVDVARQVQPELRDENIQDLPRDERRRRRPQPDEATGVTRSLSSPKFPNRLCSPTKQTTGHGILARLHVFWYSIDKRQIRQMAME